MTVSEAARGPEKEPAFYTIPDLMARWQVSRSTIYNEIYRGRLKRKHIAGLARFSVEEIHRYEREAG